MESKTQATATPITDAFVQDWRNPPTVATFGTFARKLEADRAALIAALEAIANSWQPHGSETNNAIADAMAAKARATLAQVAGSATAPVRS